MKTKTQEQFNNEVKSLVGNEYTFLENYVNQKTKIKVRHNSCGNVYYVAPKNFLKVGNRCKKCAIRKTARKHTKTQSEFCNEVASVSNGEYEVMSKYVNSSTKVKIKHSICGYTYWIRPDSFLRGSRCTKCLKQKYALAYTKTTATYAKEVNEVTEGEYTLLSEYSGVKTKVSIRHNTCGTVYSVYPYLFNKGRRCPTCGSMSYGEHYTEEALIKLRINYKTQVTFPSCKDVHLLSYDFLIPELKVLIEYQGKQHYKPVKLFGGISTYKTQVKHDNIKRSYAIKNGFTLVEIPYTVSSKKDIEDFIENKLTSVKHGVSHLN